MFYTPYISNACITEVNAESLMLLVARSKGQDQFLTEGISEWLSVRAARILKVT